MSSLHIHIIPLSSSVREEMSKLAEMITLPVFMLWKHGGGGGGEETYWLNDSTYSGKRQRGQRQCVRVHKDFTVFSGICVMVNVLESFSSLNDPSKCFTVQFCVDKCHFHCYMKLTSGRCDHPLAQSPVTFILSSQVQILTFLQMTSLLWLCMHPIMQTSATFKQTPGRGTWIVLWWHNVLHTILLHLLQYSLPLSLM